MLVYGDHLDHGSFLASVVYYRRFCFPVVVVVVVVLRRSSRPAQEGTAY